MKADMNVFSPGIVNIVATLVIILTACCPVNLSQNVSTLDLAPNSVDDQFIGCENVMSIPITRMILRAELRSNQRFRNAWNLYHNISDDFIRSIKVYTYGNGPYVEFNEAVSSGRQTYIGNFTYKSLHFFLTRAIQMHQVQKCINVLRRTKVYFDFNVTDPVMRFGRFASASLLWNLTHFGTVSCFNITTCYGADISNMSTLHNEAEVLIPPYEKFKITSVNMNNTGLDCEVLYTLESIGNFSNMNCELMRRKNTYMFNQMPQGLTNSNWDRFWDFLLSAVRWLSSFWWGN